MAVTRLIRTITPHYVPIASFASLDKYFPPCTHGTYFPGNFRHGLLLPSIYGALQLVLCRVMLRPVAQTFSSSVRTLRSLPSCLVSARERGIPIDVHPEVEQALVENRALVALETTIVTHGMPYPANLETAKSVEQHVRSVGAIPATIGVIGGRVKIGLESAELEYLADLRANPGAVKLSRRDIAAAVALKKDGGTTCSATLILAALAGIKV